MNTLRRDKAGSVIQPGNKPYTVVPVSVAGRGTIKMIFDNDIEEAAVFQGSCQCNLCWALAVSLCFSETPDRRDTEPKRALVPGIHQTLQNRGHTRQPNRSWRLVHRPREATCGNWRRVPPMWVTMDLFLIVVSQSHAECQLSLPEKSFSNGKMGSYLFWQTDLPFQWKDAEDLLGVFKSVHLDMNMGSE